MTIRSQSLTARNNDYKKLGIRGIFGDDEKLDEIELAIIEKNKRFNIGKGKAGSKEDKLDDKIKNYTDEQLKKLINQDRHLLSTHKRVWKGKKGVFHRSDLRQYFRKIDAMKLFKQRMRAKNHRFEF